ncbi:hypothetical protein ACWV26_11385 [Rummeliibacillus sp. JY-2-4R]
MSDYNEWSVQVYANPGIVGWDLSPHVYFWSGDAEFADNDPSFSSPHVNTLGKEEVTRANSRIKSLLRIVSGISILTREKTIPSYGPLYYYNGKHYSKPRVEEDIDILIEELENPFDKKVAHEIREREIERKSWQTEQQAYTPKLTEFIMDECIENVTARNLLLWLALGEEQLLYFITNAYKIMDSIKTDTGIYTKNRDASEIPTDLKQAADEMQKHARYMNTKASSGILSRHGEKSEHGPKKSPSIEKMKKDLNELVLAWFRYRFDLKYSNT